MCTQVLEVAEGIDITNVTVSAGHPSSSSIYPACFAPYVITTACSDGTVRFWKCQTVDTSGASDDRQLVKYEWHEWEMMIRTEDTSVVKVPGLYQHHSVQWAPLNSASKYSEEYSPIKLETRIRGLFNMGPV